jgi:thioredoxin-related protein
MTRTLLTGLLITAGLFMAPPLAAQEEAASDTVLHEDGVRWLTLEEAETLHRDAPRNFIFMVYSEDCHWCQKMAQEVLSDAGVAEKINTQFYPVRFTMVKTGQFFISSLLLNVFGAQSFPAIFFFSDNFQPIVNTSGFLPLDQFNPYLLYAGDTKYYQNMSFDDFKKTWDSIQSVKNPKKE